MDSSSALIHEHDNRTQANVTRYLSLVPLRHLPLLCAFVAACAGLLLQEFIVRYNYDGNWTALYRTGAQYKLPPAALSTENVYVFPNWWGYDGQMYHYMVHDPFLRRGFSAAIDSPRLRYRRILVPLSAWLLGAGQDRFVDYGYFAVLILCIFLGTWWVALIAQHFRASPVWSLAFLLLPAVLVSLDRMTIDIGLVAVTAGVVYYAYRNNWIGVFILCVLAGLIRESGLLIPAGIAGWLAYQRRFRHAGVIVLSTVPTFAWYLYVTARTPVVQFDHVSPAPFVGIVHRLLHPFPYEYSLAVYITATVLDYAAVTGIIAAIFYCVLHRRRYIAEPGGWIAFAFIVLVAFVSSSSVWVDSYAFARVFCPLILLVGLDGFRTRSALALAPLALTLPRISLRLAPQIVHSVQVLLGHSS